MNSSGYRPEIDGLRAIAVMAVVVHHLSESLLPGGYVGVDVFFVISGYLITSIILRELDTGRFHFSSFYERRVRRIFPALFVMLAATLAMGYLILLPSDYAATLRAVISTLLFTSNILFWRQLQEGYFAADADLNPLLHTWSLAVEEQFYLLFPLIMIACYRYMKRYLFHVLLCAGLVSLYVAALLVEPKPVATFFLPLTRAWELLVGSLLSFKLIPRLQSGLVRELVVGSGLLVILFVFFAYDSATTFPGLAALLPVLGAAAIIHGTTLPDGGSLRNQSARSITLRALQLRPVVYIGLISYSLYLWHWPVITFSRFALGFAATDAYLPGLFIVSLALASLSYHLIEKPFRQPDRVSRRTLYWLGATVASALVFVSVNGLVDRGFESRFSDQIVSIDRARMGTHPLQHCVGASLNAPCLIGEPTAEPSILLWGDSMVMSWSPAFDQGLAALGLRAVLVSTAGCPPFLSQKTTIGGFCASRNREVEMMIKENSRIQNVVLIGMWPLYFPSKYDNKEPSSTTKPAVEALSATLDWLLKANRQAIVLGPVASYPVSVPLVTGTEMVTGRELLPHRNLEAQISKNHLFFETMSTFSDQPLVTLIDPLPWMCPGICLVNQKESSLYTDEHHLTVEGALLFKPQLQERLEKPLLSR